MHSESNDYQKAFLDGYEKSWKSTLTTNGLLGLGTWVAAYLSVLNVMYY